MSESVDKMREDIKRLEKEINERQDYFNSELKSKLMKVANMVSVQQSFTPFHESYKQGRLKIIFTRFRYSKRWSKKYTIRRIVIRYKYRTVLLFEYNDFDDKSSLKIFHPCDWLSHIDALCERIPQMLQEEDSKDELKRLKKRQKKLKAKCKSFKALCEE